MSRTRRRQTGVAAVIGGFLVAGTPWLGRAVFGDRPYVATWVDPLELLGWVALVAATLALHDAFGARYGRLGRAGTAASAVGTGLLALVALRAVGVLVSNGFQPVPATGEDPAGLVVTFAVLGGLALAYAGLATVGVALRRTDGTGTRLVAPLVAPLVLLAAGLALRSAGFLPPSVARAAVQGGLFLPLGLGWVGAGVALLVAAGHRRG